MKKHPRFNARERARIQKGLESAYTSHTLADIGRATDIGPVPLSIFKARGILGSDKLGRLRNWLIENNFLGEVTEELFEQDDESIQKPPMIDVDTFCPECNALVPGPFQGARFCMKCGLDFRIHRRKDMGLYHVPSRKRGMRKPTPEPVRDSTEGRSLESITEDSGEEK